MNRKYSYLKCHHYLHFFFYQVYHGEEGECLGKPETEGFHLGVQVLL